MALLYPFGYWLAREVFLSIQGNGDSVSASLLNVEGYRLAALETLFRNLFLIFELYAPFAPAVLIPVR